MDVFRNSRNLHGRTYNFQELWIDRIDYGAFLFYLFRLILPLSGTYRESRTGLHGVRKVNENITQSTTVAASFTRDIELFVALRI
jgi:hypothetical protein